MATHPTPPCKQKVGLFCTKHGGPPIDIWYDCDDCGAEAFEWAQQHGFEYCVSPYIQREGTDNGAWVTQHKDRWKYISHEAKAEKKASQLD